MVTYFPFVYFCVLSVILYRKRGLDASVFISLLYVITSLCSIFMFSMGLVESIKSEPSVLATIVYCVLLTLCIIPIARFKTSEIDLIITKRTERFLERMTLVFFLVFVLYTILNIREVIDVLMYGDFAELRTDKVSEDVGHASGVLGYFNIVLGLFATISFLMIPVFFICMIYFKKGVFFSLCAICGSLTSLLVQILGVSRAGIFYYVIIFGLCLILFWKKLRRKTKLTVTILMSVVFLGMGVYFSRVTIDRFDDNDTFGGSQGGIVAYAGMPYTNFCYFFDNKPYTGISTRFLLPFTNFIVNGYRGGTQRETEMTKLTNMNSVVFMTFLGSFIMDCNQLMAFVYVLLFTLLMHVCIRNKHGTRISFFWLVCLILLMTVPAIGCITYFYTSPFKSLSLILFLVVVRYFKI